MTHLPPLLRSRRAVAALAIVAIAAFIVAPDTIVRGLPFIVVLACPLMMVFMMGPMHRMPATSPAPREGDPYAPEALTRRLVELDAERAAISDLLAARDVDRSADPPSRAAAGMTSAAHAKRT
jgi:hypothetical protein